MLNEKAGSDRGKNDTDRAGSPQYRKPVSILTLNARRDIFAREL